MGPNYISEIGKLTLLNIDGEIITQMFPEKRLFPIERQSTTEVAIHRKISGDLYAVLGDGDSSKGYTLRIYYKPLVIHYFHQTYLRYLHLLANTKSYFYLRKFLSLLHD